MNTLIVILKLLGLLLAGLSAFCGTLYETRDQAGKLTRWGRWALRGAVVGTVLALGAQFGDTFKEHRDSKERHEETTKQLDLTRQAVEGTRKSLTLTQQSVEGTQKTLAQVNRAVYILSPMSVTVFFAVPVQSKPAPSNPAPSNDVFGLAGYCSRLDSEIARLTSEFPKEKGAYVSNPYRPPSDPDTIMTGSEVGTGADVTFNPDLVNFGKQSGLYPKPTGAEKRAFQFLTRWKLTLAIRSRGSWENPEAYDPASLPSEDLDAEASPEGIRLTYDLNRRSLTVICRDMSAGITRNRGINSLPDLAGAQMFVSLAPSDVGNEVSNTTAIRIHLFRVQVFGMKVGNYWFNLSDDGTSFDHPYTSFSPIEHRPFYEYHFPQTLNEILALSHDLPLDGAIQIDRLPKAASPPAR